MTNITHLMLLAYFVVLKIMMTLSIGQYSICQVIYLTCTDNVGRSKCQNQKCFHQLRGWELS